MIPRELIATAKIAGGVELRLIRHGADHMIELDGNELMSSRMGGSEEALAVMACERLKTQNPSLLIGGYGMGFTLRAALGVLGAEGRVKVVEVAPEIIDWARGPMAALTGDALEDPRLELVIGDVATEISAARNHYDAILLDVDNGPDGLSRIANDRIYAMQGLGEAMAALKPRGVLAIWSAGPDAAFTKRLKNAGFKVEEVAIRARANGKGPRHVIWFARKP